MKMNLLCLAFLFKEIPFMCPRLRELQAMFEVKELPTVVVLRPDGSVLAANAAQDICSYGSECFRDWQESAELIERTFMLNEEFDNLNLRSVSDPVRRLKYKTEDDKRKKRWWKLWGKNKDAQEGEEESAGMWDAMKREKDRGVWRTK